MIRFVTAALSAMLFVATASADVGWPGADYDPDIPTLQEVVGHAPGERLTNSADAQRYLRALAEAAPERTRLVEYARSWQGRPLTYLLIATPERIAALGDIRSDIQRLAHPRDLDDAAARRLIDRLPAVVWLAYGVHGNEISSTDAALFTAYHLLASRDDDVARMLEETLVAIDPDQNPDGRERFVHHYIQTEGIEPASSAIAAERREPWPNGRSNHYLFDMNRDWLGQTQPESQGRAATFREYYPLIHADVHEMGTDTSYYFPPPAEPFNPHITQGQLDRLERVGRNIGRHFDRFGFEYFTREIFDALYPGYGDSWPAFHGAVGMTFEMASARGLAGQRQDGSVVTYAEGVQRHFVASIATVDAGARHRRELLEAFYDYRRSAVRGDHGGPREYLLPPGRDPEAAREFAGRLLDHGIEVRRTTSATRACGVDLPAGSYLISSRQGAGRLVRTLLDDDSPIAEAFLAEQERRRSRGLGAELYDVLGWALPRLYNLTVTPCDRAVGGDARALSADDVFEVRLPEAAEVAWLVPWGSRASGRFLAAAMRDGLVVRGAVRPMTLEGREYARGTLVIRVADHPDMEPSDLHSRVVSLARASRAEVRPTDSSWTTAGTSFGSNNVPRLHPPRIALAWDMPTRSLSAGHTRFTLERQIGYPVETVRVAHLGEPDLDRFDVLILPDGGNYAAILGSGGVERIRSWVHRGGTIVGLAGATDFLASAPASLLPAKRERGLDSPAAETVESGPVAGVRIDDADGLAAMIAAADADPDWIPGVVMRAHPDPDHWLTVGLAEELNFMVEGRRVYRPLRLDEGVNAVTFAGADRLVVSGHLWEENREQWAYKPAVMVAEHGAGVVVAFTTDPNFRGLMDGLNTLFVNAVLRAPAHTGRLR